MSNNVSLSDQNYLNGLLHILQTVYLYKHFIKLKTYCTTKPDVMRGQQGHRVPTNLKHFFVIYVFYVFS